MGKGQRYAATFFRVNILLLLSTILEKLDRDDEAIVILNQLLSYLEEHTENPIKKEKTILHVLTLRARLHETMDENKEALSDIDKLIEAKVASADDYARKGRVLRKLFGATPEALANFDLAIEMSPNSVWPLYDRANMFLFMGRYDDILRDLDRAISLPAFEQLDNDDKDKFLKLREEILAIIGHHKEEVKD